MLNCTADMDLATQDLALRTWDYLLRRDDETTARSPAGSVFRPLVLTLSLGRRDNSPRWKEVVEPKAGRFTHHLELRSEDEIDGEVRSWIREAWDGAG